MGWKTLTQLLPHIPLYSLTGEGRLLTTGRASREVAGCAEAEEVQAVSRSSHLGGRGPAHTHAAQLPQLSSPGYRDSLRRLPEAKQSCPPFRACSQGARMTWKRATPSLTLRVTSGNSQTPLPKPQFITLRSGAIGELS